MNTQEVIAKLNKYKEMLEGEVDADIKSRYASKISQLEATLKEAEQKVEKLEEKVALEEKKELSEAEKKIKKYQDYLDGETDPDLKTRYQKKIKELQDSLKEVKEEIKEEKKEVAEQKVEIKKAIKAVKSAKATKVEKKEAIEKVEKKVRERKEVSVKRTRRSKEIKRIIGDLDKLIEKNKKLKQKYTGKGVDVKKDASRSAKPFGYRFAGKHDYRVPTKAQIKAGKANGKVVYESRANRSDVFPKGQKGKSYAKLAKGGQINMDKHIWEGWTVGSFIEELDLDFRYHPKFKSRDEVKKWAMENQPYYKKYIPEVVDYYWEKNEQKYADGGEVEYTKKQIIYILNDVGYEVDDNNFDELAINEGFKYKDGVWYRTDDFAKGGKTPIVRTQFEEEEFEYGHGGMMGNKYTIAEAKKMLDAEKSKNENFSWFVPDVDYEGEDYDQEYGVHLSDKGLLDLADEIYKKGGYTQGYDDREDERLAMKYGKMSKKDLDSTYARRDDARFEERGKMAKGGRVGNSKEDKARFAKPAGWRWKDSAVKKKIITSAQLSKSPSKAMREKYPNYVYFEDRLNKADKNPSRKYLSA